MAEDVIEMQKMDKKEQAQWRRLSERPVSVVVAEEDRFQWKKVCFLDLEDRKPKMRAGDLASRMAKFGVVLKGYMDSDHLMHFPITAIQVIPGTKAAKIGVKPGMVLKTLHLTPLDELALEATGECLVQPVKDWGYAYEYDVAVPMGVLDAILGNEGREARFLRRNMDPTDWCTLEAFQAEAARVLQDISKARKEELETREVEDFDAKLTREERQDKWREKLVNWRGYTEAGSGAAGEVAREAGWDKRLTIEVATTIQMPQFQGHGPRGNLKERLPETCHKDLKVSSGREKMETFGISVKPFRDSNTLLHYPLTCEAVTPGSRAESVCSVGMVLKTVRGIPIEEFMSDETGEMMVQPATHFGYSSPQLV